MADKKVLVKATILNKRNPKGSQVNHFGYLCTVGDEGVMTVEMDAAMAKSEIAAKRFHPVTPEAKPTKTDG